MLPPLVVILLLFPALYLVTTLWLSRGLQLKDRVEKAPFDSTVTVVIAARNEENTLPVLLESLRKQTFDRKRLEIVVVNDRSTDRTAAVLEKWQEKLSHLQVVTLSTTDTTLAPKKFALAQAIAVSTGDIIITTDADCEVGPQWIENISALFSDPAVGLVQGVTLYRLEKTTLLWLFQSLDFFSHSVVAAAGIGKNLPINSNANNFAYRRSLYERLKGYGKMGKVISGDDDLFLQRVWEEGALKILFLKEKNTNVVTTPVTTWRALLEQRKRWGSKTLYYKNIQKIVLSQIFIFYLAVIVCLFLSIFSVIPWWVTVYYFGVKLVGELFFLVPARAMWNPPFSIAHALWCSPLQLIIVLYAVFGGVFGKFNWKGETFKRSR